MYCTHCGAEIDEHEVNCPYCGYLNPYGAERHYMKELEVIRKKTDELDDHPEESVKTEVKRKGRRAGFIFLIALLIIGGIIVFFLAVNFLIERITYRDSARSEMEFRDRYVPELDRLLEEGRDEEACRYMSELYDKEGSSYLWEWEHYEYLYMLGNLDYVRHVFEDEEGISEHEFVNAAAGVVMDVMGERSNPDRPVPPEDAEKIRAILEEEQQLLFEVTGLTGEEIREAYESVKQDGWVPYDALERKMHEYWDRVPEERRRG